jgi:hypothetical protein
MKAGFRFAQPRAFCCFYFAARRRRGVCRAFFALLFDLFKKARDSDSLAFYRTP